MRKITKQRRKSPGYRAIDSSVCIGNATQRKLFFEYPTATESYEHSEQPNPCRQEGPFVFRIAGLWWVGSEYDQEGKFVSDR